jgi:hypothetical protein
LEQHGQEANQTTPEFVSETIDCVDNGVSSMKLPIPHQKVTVRLKRLSLACNAFTLADRRILAVRT